MRYLLSNAFMESVIMSTIIGTIMTIAALATTSPATPIYISSILILFMVAWMGGFVGCFVFSATIRVNRVNVVMQNTQIDFGEAAKMLYYFNYPLDENPEKWDKSAINRDYETYKQRGLL